MQAQTNRVANGRGSSGRWSLNQVKKRTDRCRHSRILTGRFRTLSIANMLVTVAVPIPTLGPIHYTVWRYRRPLTRCALKCGVLQITMIGSRAI